ncbi:MAG TPA: ABC transporter ATP-binding protein [Candidatus Limivivens merdigallinarum]|uniref:ABC transporter ATP-binding protein n=1 Tax=Candidatus Limivivens merdigallinarum TaxID=2840859 RepID=A0A9D0ZVG8_9FIRM|nr:ABC transporter ATP-binding protein [Candidatus Limivivens merdigallinarum]
MEILVKQVSKSLGKRQVLKEINFEARSGEIVGIIGRNGSGKSVFFKCLVGLFQPNSGEIWIGGEKISPKSRLGSRVGMIIEQPGFLPQYSGYRNLKILAALQGRAGKKEIEESLKAVGLYEERNKQVGKYSMGMKQRLALAQAMMEDPPVLILDEPMNGLDKKGVEEMRRLLGEMRERRKLILMASHNKEDIELLCDRVYEMDAGEISLKING